MQASTPFTLARSWVNFIIFSGLSLTAGFIALANIWGPGYAIRWLPLAALGLLYLSEVLRRNLSANHRQGETELLPELGWGNRLTLLRGVLVSGLLGFLLLPQPDGWLVWVPGLLYTLSDVTDFFDGYVARRTNHATRLGEILDMSFDGLGVLAAAVLLVQWNQVPAWYLLIGIARFLFLGGMALRTRLGWSIHPLPPSVSRRLFAGMQMGLMAALMLPLFSPPATHIAATLFGLPLLIGFVKDWLYVSGVIQPVVPALQDRSHSPGHISQFFLILGIATRLGIAALVLLLAQRDVIINPGLSSSIAHSIEPAWIDITRLAHFAVAALVVAGVLPRIAAIIALCLLGFQQIAAPLDLSRYLLVSLYTLLIYFGPGAWTLYTPEETLFHRPAGARQTSSQEIGA